MRTRLRPGVVLLTLLALVPVAAGCGELGGDTRPTRRTPVITTDQIDRSEEGTPERAFLDWFRDLHERDTDAAARLYLPGLGLTAADIARQRQAGAYALDPLALPIISDVTVNGDEARVRARFRTGRVWPNGRVDYTAKEAVTFRLRRVDGRWLLADNGFLELVAREDAGAPPDAAEPKVPVVGRRQLARHAPGTPARAFLEWFRALQRSEARKAARYYPPSLGISVRELARQRRRAEVFDGFGPPIVVGASESGNRAVVTARTRVVTGGSGDRPEYKVSKDIPFQLVKIDGRWRLTSNGFLELLARVPAG